MYVAIDIGGTKTLVAVLNNEGVIVEQIRFLTDKKYQDFLNELKKTIPRLEHKDFIAGGIGLPATRLDRKHGKAFNFSNLPWEDVNILEDIKDITNCPMVIENDAKMAALSESMLLKDKYKEVLYVTISTGIGFGLVLNGKIDTSIGDGGGKTILLEYKDRLMPWEEFASGHAIYKKYGKKAKDIKDEKTWREISHELAKGFIHLIAIMQPEVIVIGGGVGNYFNRFSHFLRDDIEKYKIPLIKMPVIIEAQRPDEAVIYGCYDLAKQYYPNGKSN
jgi:glucokinase